MHPKKVIAERAHKWEPRGKRMNRASRRGQNKNINTYCHTRWSPFSPLDRHYPSIVAATSNLAPFSSLSLLTGREGRCSCDTHRQRLIHETLQNGYTPAQILFSLRSHRNACIVYISKTHDHTPKIIIKHSLRWYRTSNTVLSVFKLDREKSRGNAFDEYKNRKHRHLRFIYPR